MVIREKVFTVVMASVFVVSLVMTLLLTSVQVVAFSSAFYSVEFKKYNISEQVKISYDNLLDISKDIRRYLMGKRRDLNIVVNVGGKERTLFDRRELLHMEDVKRLFEKGFLVRNISAGLLFISIVYFGIKRRFYLCYQLVKWVVLLSVGLTVIAFILFYVDFNRYFTYFHLIFFNNNLWLLDPSKEMLVNLFPQDFFGDAAFCIFAGYLLGLFAVLIIMKAFHKRECRM